MTLCLEKKKHFNMLKNRFVVNHATYNIAVKSKFNVFKLITDCSTFRNHSYRCIIYILQLF